MNEFDVDEIETINRNCLVLCEEYPPILKVTDYKRRTWSETPLEFSEQLHLLGVLAHLISHHYLTSRSNYVSKDKRDQLPSLIAFYNDWGKCMANVAEQWASSGGGK